MNKTYKALSLPLVCAAMGQPALAAGFLEDSKASLQLRNYHIDRDYKDDGARSAVSEWAQGFIFKYSSGYTPGTLGVGLDAQAFLGLKLDSGAGQSGTGLLPVHDDGDAADEYSELGLTAKFRLSRTELLLGTQYPMFPIALTPYTRLFPQTYHGGSIRSTEIDGLTLHAGKFDRTNLRDSTDYETMGVASPNGRFDRTARSNDFRYLGGFYQWSPALTLKYFHAELEDLYKQDYLGFIHELPLGPGKLKSDLRYFDSREDGAAQAGEVDSRSLHLILGYSLGAHRFGAGITHMSGDTAMPYLAGSDADVMSEGLFGSDYLNPNEKAWQVRYGYDFSAVGLPGLTGSLSYTRGTDIDLPEHLGGRDREESEKQVELAYVVQSGSFQGLGLRLRHSWYRNDFASTASFRDENHLRINVDYRFDLL
ncbi:OprD family porin [Zestomonas carbonaria]|uniref:Porin-like protein NicP n=1 Tax=Zestomonas carbonaria TaxID=2762745 RepID=A0A7U7I963_9GAMM|nr:OprD family porin [Pseudomonas carbonaria]CAD5107891.1 Porin-like protein NicP [Pseudomonas carbonaria]